MICFRDRAFYQKSVMLFCLTIGWISLGLSLTCGGDPVPKTS
jgi:hypothetical protein